MINPIHVKDAVFAIEKLLHLENNFKINLGGMEVVSLRELSEIIGKKLRKTPIFKENLETKEKRLVADLKNMREILDYCPSTSLEEGLGPMISQKTVAL